MLKTRLTVFEVSSDIYEYGGSMLGRIGRADSFSRAVTAIFSGLIERWVEFETLSFAWWMLKTRLWLEQNYSEIEFPSDNCELGGSTEYKKSAFLTTPSMCTYLAGKDYLGFTLDWFLSHHHFWDIDDHHFWDIVYHHLLWSIFYD